MENELLIFSEKRIMYNWNNYIKVCLFVLVIILVSCSREEMVENMVEKGDVYGTLQIGSVSGIPVQSLSTRSTTELSTGDIGVFRLASTGYTETRDNVKYTKSDSGWDVDTGTEPISLTSDASLCCYYPYSSNEDYTDGSVTLTSQLYSESADLCYQTSVSAVSGTPVSFSLGHAYAKLNFIISHNSTYSGNCAVSNIKIENDGILSSGTLNMTTGNYGSGTVGAVTVDPAISSIASGSFAEVTVLMVPVATLLGDITVTFTLDDTELSPVTVDVSAHNLTSLAAGKNYSLDFNINGTSAEVTSTANCYIIAPGSSLNVPVNVRGNGGDVAGTGLSTVINPSSLGILWETSADLISLGDLSDNKVTVTTGSATGNAVIAAYSGADQAGTILWSWHIWVTDYDPDNDTDPDSGTTFTIINSKGFSYDFMDRNLGATTASAGVTTTMGLLYQWGRKDPFPGSASYTTETEPVIYNALGTGSDDMIGKEAVSSDANLSNTIENPLTYYYGTGVNNVDWYSVTADTHNDALWGGADKNVYTAKTIFDPCPAGWRVPSWKEDSPWSDFSTTTFNWSDTDYGCTYTSGTFYPAAGCRFNESGDLYSVSSSSPNGPFGYYWSGLQRGTGGYRLYFYDGYVTPAGYNYRAGAYSVRCVKE